ncbi:MAG TPA: chemotaxis protein CheW [bacterium]|nr:chemotaxis protein CheW [bacterium]HPO10164.1 chemotaxis protein CheW [bacterium]HQO34696.1 chemotaxis protein CheW [bacterium]HQP97665.1 chemotaxis protein CheW [bacterium]
MAAKAVATENLTQQYVSFILAREEYGIDILKVQEIIRFESLTRIPQSLSFVEGILNLRGKVVPVMDLRTRFGLPRGERDRKTRIMVVNVNGREMGLIVDQVSEVLQVDSDQVSPPPPMGASISAEYIRGMARIEERLMILLDVEKILSSEELAAL